MYDILLEKLIPYLQSQCFNLVRPHLKVKNIVVFVFYKFANGHSASHMVDCFNVGASSIRKYVNIVCDVFTNINKLFNKYTNNPIRNQLKLMI
jgi:hypothetical protein